MKKLPMTLLFTVAASNVFLAWSGMWLANELRRTFRFEGVEKSLPYFTQFALSLPPWFYGIFAITVIFAALSFWKRLSEEKLFLGTLTLMFLDLVGLLVCLWGFCAPFLLIG